MGLKQPAEDVQAQRKSLRPFEKSILRKKSKSCLRFPNTFLSGIFLLCTLNWN